MWVRSTPADQRTTGTTLVFEKLSRRRRDLPFAID
jgi:hypothetical protein